MKKAIIFQFILLIKTNLGFCGDSLEALNKSYSESSRRIYLLTIGIDNCIFFSGVELAFSQSDADNFEKHVASDVASEIKSYRVRNNSSKADLLSYINFISQQAQKNDVFIFYYAGFSNNGNIFLSNDSISYFEIYNYSQNIYCERQLLFIDCNEGYEFKKGLIGEIQKKPLEKKFTNIDRVLFYPTGISLEGIKNSCNKNYNGGLFTGSFINSGFKATDFFNNRNDYFLTNLKHSIYKCLANSLKDVGYDFTANPITIDFFSEKEYISELNAYNTNFSRGKQIYPKSIDSSNYHLSEGKNEKIKIERGNTLCILLGNKHFKFKQYDELKNTLEDAVKIEHILNSKYKTSTILLQDISYKKFIDTLNYIHDNYTFEKGCQLMFFAASHADKDKYGIGRLIFTDSDPNNLDPSSVELQTLKQQILSFGATNSLMLMDICYSGSAFEDNKFQESNCTTPTTREIPLSSPIFTNSSIAYKNYLNQETNLYFGSSQRDQEAADGEGPNSPFATVIISFLESNKLPVIDSYHLRKSIETVMDKKAFSEPIFCSYNCKPDGRFLFIRK
jgi:hypothetical protein